MQVEQTDHKSTTYKNMFMNIIILQEDEFTP